MLRANPLRGNQDLGVDGSRSVPTLNNGHEARIRCRAAIAGLFQAVGARQDEARSHTCTPLSFPGTRLCTILCIVERGVLVLARSTRSGSQ